MRGTKHGLTRHSSHDMKLLLLVKGLDEFVEVSEDFSGDVVKRPGFDDCSGYWVTASVAGVV